MDAGVACHVGNKGSCFSLNTTYVGHENASTRLKTPILTHAHDKYTDIM